MKLPFKLPLWLYSEIVFSFDNRWRYWLKGGDYFCIWLGTEFQRGDGYHKICNVYTFDLTIFNFGFKVRFRGNPAVSFALLEQRKCATQPTTHAGMLVLRRLWK